MFLLFFYVSVALSACQDKQPVTTLLTGAGSTEGKNVLIAVRVERR